MVLSKAQWPKLTSLWLHCSVLGRDRKTELFYSDFIPLLAFRIVFHSVCSSSLATTTLVSRNEFASSRAYQKYNSLSSAILARWRCQRLLSALAFRFKEKTTRRIASCSRTTEVLELLQDTVGWGPSDVQTHSFQFLGMTVRAHSPPPSFEYTGVWYHLTETEFSV